MHLVEILQALWNQPCGTSVPVQTMNSAHYAGLLYTRVDCSWTLFLVLHTFRELSASVLPSHNLLIQNLHQRLANVIVRCARKGHFDAPCLDWNHCIL